MAKAKTKKSDVELRYVKAPGFHVSQKQFEDLVDVIVNKWKGERPTPEALIKEAKRKTSKIHHLFNWDVDQAAYSHWKTRAQEYLRSINVVKVRISTGKVISAPVRAFQPIVYEGQKITSYVPTQRIHETKDIDVIMERAKNDFQALIRRYKNYEEFFILFEPVIKAMDEVVLILDTKKKARKK